MRDPDGVRNASDVIRQTGVVQREFNMWAIIIDCSCNEVPINPIIKSITIIISHANLLHVTIYLYLEKYKIEIKLY
jgi:hypothetical protein